MENISEKDTTISGDNKDDNEEKLEKLLQQISELKLESQQFSVQRAKMKELFVQKEDEEQKLRDEKKMFERELDDTRCQVAILGIEWESERTKTQQELNSLQELLNETLEENSKREDELKQLKLRNEKVESELNQLKAELNERPLLGVPGAMLSTLAKKVVSQLGSNEPTHESLEESMRKAKEDAEVLKSLLLPLEEEIGLLKTKLRDTDGELRRYQQIVYDMQKDTSLVNGSVPGESLINITSEDVDSSKSNQLTDCSPVGNDSDRTLNLGRTKGCEMCSNYEAQLVQAEKKYRDLEKQLSMLDRYKEELAKETVFRKQMEEKWSEKKELHKAQVAELQEKLKAAETSVRESQQLFSKTCANLSKQFELLSRERKEVQERLDRLQLENENLVGKYNAHSRELQNEAINLPDSVEVLQEMWLKQSDDLIKARIGQEMSEETLKTYECMCCSLQQKYDEIMADCKQLKDELAAKEISMDHKKINLRKMHEALTMSKSEIENYKSQLNKALEEKRHLEESESELRNRLVSLQTGLENGEAVQKDFVLLSQNLQKELEHLRVQNNVLRWEYEEDVKECRGCEQPFKSLNKGKGNCRHCGRVFCSSCLSHKIISGPSKRESKVCTVCHTLLDHHTPPYFSTEPPK